MKVIYHKSLKVLTWLAAVIAGWRFLGDWLAPGACMDFGGAFDYTNWRCSNDPNEVLFYMDVPAYQLQSFQIFASLVALAIALHFVWRGPRADA